ncbi:phage major capsid protein [Tundrisphaera lichenicola]|uniref:phage major capsid protein n=1 Tax=Tundrisphaera lichenicola TaxID=2029860 RepID=UPI003EBE26BE
MKTWIKLLKAHGSHKAGDLIESEKAVADALIMAGVAEDAGEGPSDALKAVGLADLNAALKSFTDGLGAAFKDATDQIAAAGRRHAIEPGPAEADKSKSLGDFINNVVRAANVSDLEGLQSAQERLRKHYGASPRADKTEKGMEESSGGAGGFWTVPTAYEKAILMEQAEDAVILPGVTSVPLSARAVEWPSLDQYKVPTKGNSAMFGGVTVSRKGEKSVRDRTQAVGTGIKLEANDLTAFTEFSRDLVQDSGDVVQSMLTQLIGGAIGFRRDWEHIWGDGVGKATGYMNAAALIPVARTTTNLVKWADIAKMISRLMPSAAKRAVWIAHPFLLEQFLTLKDDAGNLIYVPNMPGNLTGQVQINPTPVLANLPVLFTEKAAPPGTLGDFTLVDRKAILSGMRGGVEIGLSEHFLFDSDQIALRAKVRDDAQPWLKKAITLGDGAGTNKVSAFIALAA